MGQIIDKSNLKHSKVRREIWRKTGGLCWYCGDQMDPWTFSIDHFIPQQNGGQHDMDNLVPCCSSCNRRKGSRPLEEFRVMMTKRSGAVFSEAQIDYLKQRGITVPEPEPYVFYFERAGLT